MRRKIVEMAKAMEGYIIDVRRKLHMNPELRWEEEETAKFVEEELKKYGYEVRRVAGTGVVGLLKGRNGKVVALRADMDALPIKEETGSPYASKVDGKMHACGHDGHVAMLLGAARILSEIRSELAGTVKLIFQPAEEGGWGAEKLVEYGVVDDVDAVFGMHLWVALPSGVLGVKPGPLMASVDSFKVSLVGRGGHGAEPFKAVDPIAVAVDIVNAFQKIVTREVPATEPVVLSVTSINAGSAFNVVPEELNMLGTIRALNSELRNFVISRMKKVATGYASAMRCNANVELVSEGAPPVVNDDVLAGFSKDVLGDFFEIVEPSVTMIGEDFSFYAKRAKSMFMFLGIRNEEKGIVYPHHHPKFDIDEDVLYKGVVVHSIIAYEYLAKFKG